MTDDEDHNGARVPARPNSVVDADQIEGLIDAAGVDGARDILQAFWRSTDKLMAALKDQLGRGDFVEARRTAHSLKGSALNVGAIQLAYAVREIEDACRSGDASHAATRLPGAGQDYKVTFEAFDAHFARRA